MATRATRTKVPMMPVQRPHFTSMIDTPMIAHVTARPMTMLHAVLKPLGWFSMSLLDRVATTVPARVPPIQVGLLIQ